jgi:hypothetical protein
MRVPGVSLLLYGQLGPLVLQMANTSLGSIQSNNVSIISDNWYRYLSIYKNIQHPKYEFLLGSY